jgi:thiol-disulfide isomerase/thioredoxin
MSDLPSPANPRPPWKRRAVLAGGAATALGAGAWLASRIHGTESVSPVTSAPSTNTIWDWVLKTPDGLDLPLAAHRASGLILNFWATWCPPCLREFPELDRFERDMQPRGWRVVAAAADESAAVKGFLAKTPVSFAIGIGGFEALNRSKELGNTQGGLPFTAVFAPGGRLLKTILGETTRDALTSIVNSR